MITTELQIQLRLSDAGQVTMGGRTIGDLLNDAGITWGAFMGGFNLSIVNPNGTTGCNRSTKSEITGVTEEDYIPHHSLTSYWPSIANPAHTRPASIAEIGNAGPANHSYDILDFYAAVAAGNQPAVSFLKAQGIRTLTPATRTLSMSKNRL